MVVACALGSQIRPLGQMCGADYAGSMTTLQQHAAHGDTIMVYCENLTCNHSWPLNFMLAIEKLGPDFDIVENRKRFLNALVCTKCGSRNPSIILSNAAATKSGAQAGKTWGMIPPSGSKG